MVLVTKIQIGQWLTFGSFVRKWGEWRKKQRNGKWLYLDNFRNILTGMKFSEESSDSVQFSRSVVSDSLTPWTAAHQASLSITNSWSLLKLMSILSVMSSNHLIVCRPLLLLPSISASIRVFSNESALDIRWPEYWSFQLQHQSFQWIFRTDFL